jgi:hypothetical protein
MEENMGCVDEILTIPSWFNLNRREILKAFHNHVFGAFSLHWF